MVAELKSNDLHGFTMDVNYTMSRTTGSATPNGAFADANSSSIPTQDPYLLQHLTNQLQPWDYTHQVKGYVLYDLPFGVGQRWKTNRESVDNYLLGGWKIGMQLGYRTGAPLPTIMAPGQYPGWSGVFAQRNTGVPLSTGTFQALSPSRRSFLPRCNHIVIAYCPLGRDSPRAKTAIARWKASAWSVILNPQSCRRRL